MRDPSATRGARDRMAEAAAHEPAPAPLAPSLSRRRRPEDDCQCRREEGSRDCRCDNPDTATTMAASCKSGLMTDALPGILVPGLAGSGCVPAGCGHRHCACPQRGRDAVEFFSLRCALPDVPRPRPWLRPPADWARQDDRRSSWVLRPEHQVSLSRGDLRADCKELEGRLILAPAALLRRFSERGRAPSSCLSGPSRPDRRSCLKASRRHDRLDRSCGSASSRASI